MIKIALIELVDVRGHSRRKMEYDDIKQTRQINAVNNFWKFLANHSKQCLRPRWESFKEVM